MLYLWCLRKSLSKLLTIAVNIPILDVCGSLEKTSQGIHNIYSNSSKWHEKNNAISIPVKKRVVFKNLWNNWYGGHKASLFCSTSRKILTNLWYLPCKLINFAAAALILLLNFDPIKCSYKKGLEKDKKRKELLVLQDWAFKHIFFKKMFRE